MQVTVHTTVDVGHVEVQPFLSDEGLRRKFIFLKEATTYMATASDWAIQFGLVLILHMLEEVGKIEMGLTDKTLKLKLLLT